MKIIEQLEKNKYFQDKIVFENFLKDNEFGEFFELVNNLMKENYVEDNFDKGIFNVGIEDFSLGFKDIERAIKNFIFVLEKYPTTNLETRNLVLCVFDNNFINKKIASKEAILSSAIYHLIIGDKKLKNKFNYKKYINICLDYLDKRFKYTIELYKSAGYGKEFEKEFEGGQEQYILGEYMYDVPFWKNIYLTYGENEYKYFAIGEYLKCIRK